MYSLVLLKFAVLFVPGLLNLDYVISGCKHFSSQQAFKTTVFSSFVTENHPQESTITDNIRGLYLTSNILFSNFSLSFTSFCNEIKNKSIFEMFIDFYFLNEILRVINIIIFRILGNIRDKQRLHTDLYILYHLLLEYLQKNQHVTSLFILFPYRSNSDLYASINQT